MENEIQTEKRIKRRRFFITSGKGVLALIAFKIIPFRFSNKKKHSNSTVKIKIHPDAVQRKYRG